MAKPDLSESQLKVLDLLEKTKEITSHIGKSKAVTYANIDDNTIFNALLNLELVEKEGSFPIPKH